MNVTKTILAIIMNWYGVFFLPRDHVSEVLNFCLKFLDSLSGSIKIQGHIVTLGIFVCSRSTLVFFRKTDTSQLRLVAFQWKGSDL